MPLTIAETKNPIKVTGTTAARELVLNGPALVRFVRWYNPTSVGDLLEMKDAWGNEIITLRCEKANQTQTEPVFINSADGIMIDNMDSGTLYIYLR